MIDDHNLQSRFSDEESKARLCAWEDIDNDTLLNNSAESLIENVVDYFAVDLVEVDFSHIWISSETKPSYETATSFYVQTTLHAKCNQSAKYIGDLTNTLVRGAAAARSTTWEIRRVFKAPSVTADPQLIARYKEDFQRDIESGSAVCNVKIREHRDRMFDEVRGIITTRVRELKGTREAAQAANIHLTPAPNPIIIPMVPKSLNLATAKQRQAAGAPVAGLANEIADELVRTLRSFALALERQPVLAGTMLTKNEEALRDILLFILNSQWEGTATGETFVGRGKTDVLVRWENADAFIAECKMWKGSSAFSEGIDQLLRYMIWRDTRAGLILFIKDKKNPSAIIESAVRSIEGHRNFVGPGAGEHEFVIHSEHDDKRRIHLSLIPVHVQSRGGDGTTHGDSTMSE